MWIERPIQGVLTKADTVLSGEETAWLQVLEGERHPLKHGYYVTRQPGPDDLPKKLSFEKAREQEHFFFTHTDPWKSAPTHIKSRTGIRNLTNELSKLLSRLIMHTYATGLSVFTVNIWVAKAIYQASQAPKRCPDSL